MTLRRHPRLRWRLSVLAGMMAATVVAAALRMVALDSYPGGLLPAEATLGLHALGQLSGSWPGWVSQQHGPLLGWWIGLVLHLSPDVTALRWGAAAVAVAAVTVTVWLWAPVGRAASALAALWLAGSLWLVVAGRLATPAAITPLLTALLLVTASRAGARRGGWTLAAGAAVGVCLWDGPQLLPPAAAAGLWLIRRCTGQSRLRLAAGLAPGVALTLVSWLANPAAYWGGGPDIAGLPANLLGELLAVTGFGGDPTAAHNVGSLPLLGLPLAALATLGAIRAWRHRDRPLEALALLALGACLLPGLVSGLPAPDYQALLPLQVPLAGLLALGAQEAVERVSHALYAAVAWPMAAAAVLAITGAGTAAALARPAATLYQAYDGPAVQMAEATGGIGPAAVAIAAPADAAVIEFLDRSAVPNIRTGLTPVPDALVYRVVAARSAAALEVATAELLTGHPVGFSPSGDPEVWIAMP